MKGAEADLSAATYQIFDESHTLGNALRWMIMKKCALSPSLSFVFTLCSDTRCVLLQPDGGVLRV
jgi:hypothetical protein